MLPNTLAGRPGVWKTAAISGGKERMFVMKKLFSLILALTMTLALAACGSKGGNAGGNTGGDAQNNTGSERR